MALRYNIKEEFHVRTGRVAVTMTGEFEVIYSVLAPRPFDNQLETVWRKTVPVRPDMAARHRAAQKKQQRLAG